MNLDIAKEQILQIKWTLEKVVKNKCEAAATHKWEAAAGFRDEEMRIIENL